MFNQVESAFNSWLSDSSKAVSAAQADATAGLNSALTQLQSVVSTMRTDLGDTTKALSQLASSTAARRQAEPAVGAVAAAGDVAGGTGGRASGAGGGGGGVAPQQQQDPRGEIAGLLSSRQYETALVKALNTTDMDVLLWTCQQVRAQGRHPLRGRWFPRSPLVHDNQGQRQFPHVCFHGHSPDAWRCIVFEAVEQQVIERGWPSN